MSSTAIFKVLPRSLVQPCRHLVYDAALRDAISLKQQHRAILKEHGWGMMHRPLTGLLGRSDDESVGRPAMTEPDGMICWVSPHGMDETLTRLREALHAASLPVIAEIDHAASAAGVGLSLSPSRVLIFGNAQATTPLLKATPTIGIDLPLKLLVWQDDVGATWLAYNDTSWMAARHGARHGNDEVLAAMRESLAAVITAVTGGGPGSVK